MRVFRFGWFLLAILLGGCQTGTPPDPNDPNEVGSAQPEVLRRNLKYASDALLERQMKGEITDVQFHEMLTQYAKDLLGKLKLESIDPKKAWEYADVYRTAQDWRTTEALLRIAVKAAKDEDRRVVDRLRLAQALAHLDRVKEAIAMARTTFDGPSEGKAPILIAVLFDVVPPARGKGFDLQLAKLLEDAIQQTQETKVNPDSEGGRLFLQARPHHVRNAWGMVVELYVTAGRRDLADKATAKMGDSYLKSIKV